MKDSHYCLMLTNVLSEEKIFLSASDLTMNFKLVCSSSITVLHKCIHSITLIGINTNNGLMHTSTTDTCAPTSWMETIFYKHYQINHETKFAFHLSKHHNSSQIKVLFSLDIYWNYGKKITYFCIYGPILFLYPCVELTTDRKFQDHLIPQFQFNWKSWTAATHVCAWCFSLLAILQQFFHLTLPFLMVQQVPHSCNCF